MWGGVIIGLAGVKLSGSPRRFGVNVDSIAVAPSRAIKPNRSLYEKYGWNETLSRFGFRPVGLEDPV